MYWGEGDHNRNFFIDQYILLRILQVVISQLKTETSEVLVQHMKAAKALLVIIPLLGITQVMFIYGPKVDHGKGEQRNSIIIFQIIRAVLLSTQVNKFCLHFK